jgi:hypothetical protein
MPRRLLSVESQAEGRGSDLQGLLRTPGNGGGCPIQLRPVFGCRQNRRWGPNSGGEPRSFRPAAGFRVPRRIGPQKMFFLVNIAEEKFATRYMGAQEHICRALVLNPDEVATFSSIWLGHPSS